MPRVDKRKHKQRSESYIVLNGKKIKLDVPPNAAEDKKSKHKESAVYYAGDTIVVNCAVNSRIVADSSSESERSDDSDDDTSNSDLAYAIVAVDHDREVHGPNLKIRWFYAKSELPCSSIGVSKDEYVFCTGVEVIDTACIVKHSRSDSNLPKKVHNALYNAATKKLDESSGFASIRQLLALRASARHRLAKLVPAKLRHVVENQTIAATDCLRQSEHAFDKCGPNQKFIKTLEKSQQIAAWFVCFGPLVAGDTLDQFQHFCSFNAHKEELVNYAADSDNNSTEEEL